MARRNLDTSPQTAPAVLIIGAGFAGLQIARELRKAPVRTILVDANNYHVFQPLLYQVATAGLEVGDIAHAVRNVLQRCKNCDFRVGRVTDVDLVGQHVLLEDATRVSYDFLIVATGVETNDYGVEGIDRFALPLKTLDDAVAVRNHILQQFEAAHREPAIIESGALNFVIVGGGATGVEVAGALTELFSLVLRKDFPFLDVGRARVILVEMTHSLLSSYDEPLRRYALDALQKRGVDVVFGHSVTRVAEDHVVLDDGETIQTSTLIWAAGVKAPPLAARLGAEQTRGGRVVVSPNLSIPGHPNVFVVGDLAACTDEEGSLHPQVASVAIQGGKHVADEIERVLEGKPPRPFVYKDLGQMATIGRHAAVVQLPSGRKLRGWIAWVAWLALHLVKLIGFRNRASVMVNWIWNYFTYDRSARLIFGSDVDVEQEMAEPRL